MAFQISQGLFSPEFTDFHAVIGVSVEASGDVIRKRYLQVARRLHPDSFVSASPVELQAASELLSKLVNPAYKKLTAKEKDLAEYQLLLKLKAQQALREGTPLLKNGKARELLQVSDWDGFYQAILKDLAIQQYSNLSQALDRIGDLSELNLVYLMRREGQPQKSNIMQSKTVAPPPPMATPQPISSSAPNVAPPPKPEAKGVDPNVGMTSQAATPRTSQPSTPLSTFIEAYCRRAEELIAKNQFSAAIKELRDALKDDPTNSRCHELMGTVYLEQKQLTMARISFDQALKYDPKSQVAISGKQQIEKLTSKGKSEKSDGKSPEKSSGGLFGLFSGRKK